MIRPFLRILMLFLLLMSRAHSSAQDEYGQRSVDPGNLEGFVFDYYGIAVSGAVIWHEDGVQTQSGPGGHYLLQGIPAGQQEIFCGKTGYNLSSVTMNIHPGDTSLYNFTLTQPNMVVYPLSISQTLNPNELFNTAINILNNGNGPLFWEATVSYLSQPQISCVYTIELFDSFGDGWNGCALDVLVNGSVVLNNIALASGYGPVEYLFEVTAGDEITTLFIPGSWINEPSYKIFNADGTEVWHSPPSPGGPANILPAQLIASCGGTGWLNLDAYSGSVAPFGGVNNIPVRLNASNTNSGELYEAEILLTSTPNIATILVPVTMTVAGAALAVPENLQVTLTSNVTGSVFIEWDWPGDALQSFLIRRDGVLVATTLATEFTDILPVFGRYCFTVQAVYDEGFTVPAGPVCVDWLFPELSADPEELEGWVWQDFTTNVFTSLVNDGAGILSFSFPEWVARELLSDPAIPKNQPGAPDLPRSGHLPKGDEAANGSGYPIVLGAGGPDSYGYVWIDSDETGGPFFEWIDIQTTGTLVTGLSDDNIVGPFDIGFEFPFYGMPKTRFWINSNGLVSFNSEYISLNNTIIPTNNSAYKDFIAWMWDDMDPGNTQSKVFYQSFPNKLVIQFVHYFRFPDGGNWLDAEVILYNNGKIKIMYDNLSPGLVTNGCTVGIQSPFPETGLQVAYNTNYLEDKLALQFMVPSEFISAVEPAAGTIAGGGSRQIRITYDAEDFEPGIYLEDLYLESNDPLNGAYLLGNTMHVYIPAQFQGVVTDLDNNQPLPGVTVVAGNFQAETNSQGAYTLYVDAGTYDLAFSRPGYIPVTVEDTLAVSGAVTPVSIGLWDANYAPAFVYAEVMEEDTGCLVSWALPEGPFEISYDDGTADDFFVYQAPGSWNAVKFTPWGYPSRVFGGKIYVGDGAFPGPFLGTQFGIAVFDDDGPGGLPGTLLDSTGVTVNNYGWVTFDWLDAEVASGSFYLAMYQTGAAPAAAPVGVDDDQPTYYRSYSRFQQYNWTLSPLQDFMIRAWVIGVPGLYNGEEDLPAVQMIPPKVPGTWQQHALTASGRIPVIPPGMEAQNMIIKGVEGMSNRAVLDYTLSRYASFDPDGSPTTGTLTELSVISALAYDDANWPELPEGWYAYGVKARYSSGLYSGYSVSNIVGHLKDVAVTVNITLTTGENPAGTEIRLSGKDYPYAQFAATTGESGSLTLETVWKGRYELSVFKIGYDLYYMDNILVDGDKTLDIVLLEKKYAPGCLNVDPLSLQATWCEPLRRAMAEDFEGADFPPPGWQATTGGDKGWYRTADGSSPNFQIPAWDSFYACTNDDLSGTTGNGSADYLITPPLDLRESDGFYLVFDSFYTGDYGQLATVEYSPDGGASWSVLHQVQPDSVWRTINVDLGPFSGPAGPGQLWLAFHADDGGEWASGWAIDNIGVRVPAPAAGYIDFHVFLDNAFAGSTASPEWNFAPLEYGREYTASVAARYTSGLSGKSHYTFTSTYLYPPLNLNGEAPDDAVFLKWDPPQPGFPGDLLGYNLYRDGNFIQYRQHQGSFNPPEPQVAMEEDMDPGLYDYEVTGVYDLAAFGHPGETGESMREGPAMVAVDYCTELEFTENWAMGGFDANRWEAGSENWSVTSLAGNPAPAARFNWSPVQSDYRIALESYPFCAAGMTEGHIWLDYDIKLETFFITGEEFLDVQVWNWTQQEWNTITQYSNAGGSFGWTRAHLDLTPFAIDQVFRIRFLATGTYSLRIVNWIVDNVHIYRSCSGPADLELEVIDPNAVRLSWDWPFGFNPGQAAGSRELSGFTIYRSIGGSDFEKIGTSAQNYFIDEGLDLGMYCYKVTALWIGETDSCESTPSDMECVMLTGTGKEQPDLSEIRILPNPSNGEVVLSGTLYIEQMTVSNVFGVVVYEEMIRGNHKKINLRGLASGIYGVRLLTPAGIIEEKLIILH